MKIKTTFYRPDKTITMREVDLESRGAAEHLTRVILKAVEAQTKVVIEPVTTPGNTKSIVYQ